MLVPDLSNNYEFQFSYFFITFIHKFQHNSHYVDISVFIESPASPSPQSARRGEAGWYTGWKPSVYFPILRG